MKAILDTHVLLWWASSGGSRLSNRARDVIENPDSTMFVSAISAYEVAVKVAARRLVLPTDPEHYLPDILRRHEFETLPVDVAHALRAGTLPPIHRDPWDRLLVAQAQVEGLPIITADPLIGRYEVETIW